MNSPEVQEDEIGLLELVIVLAKFKKIVFGLPLVVGTLAALISLVLPNEYKATTKLLPPQQQQSGAAALLSQLGGISAVAAGVAGLKNPNDLYVGMLNSRTVADRLITRFDLKKVYRSESIDKLRKELGNNTLIDSGKDGIISIEVEDENPKLAAQLSNGYVDELKILTKTLAVTEAAQRRLFYEQQLELAKNNLVTAEIKLKGALDTHGVVSVDAESRGMVETIAKMRAQISAKEIQLNSMQAFVTTHNPAYRQVEQELNSLRAELSKLENGRVNSSQPLNDTGNAQGLENIRTLRDVKYYQMLYELLAKQYEIARLDEAKDAAIIQVLDPAVEPENKSKPRRGLIVIFSMLLGLFSAIGFVIVFEVKQRVTSTVEGAAKWRQLRSHLYKH